MKRIRLRSWGPTVTLIALAIVAWLYLAPSNIGGSTRYVVTNGISMEPRFHTGDLALVRPADNYTVGEIVAYRSNMLHTVVLHRIIAIRGDSYVFKGDNNDFIDPVRPNRSELLGKLWVHVPHAGTLLRWLHEPGVAAAFVAFVALLLLAGVSERQRRRRRRRKGSGGSPRQGILPVTTARDNGVTRSTNFGARLTASAIAAAVFAVLGVIALTRPADKPSAVTTRYTQQVSFGYSAHAPHGPVYPTGSVKTGDPIFLTLVHRLDVTIKYRLESPGPNVAAGTERVLLELSGPGGWSRTMTLVPPTAISGDHTRTDVTLDVPHLQSVFDQVQRLTGISGGQFTVNVVPEIHIKGTVAGRPVKSSFTPSMSFQLATGQLLPVGASATAASSAAPASNGAASNPAAANYNADQGGSVSSPTTAPNTITVLGVSPQVGTLRLIAVIGLLLSLALTVFFYLRKRSEPFGEAYRIQAQYGHLIVPIVAGEDLGWPPVDVPNIKALVRLAESGQRLILHNRSNDVDTYLVNDEGTVYRYQVKPSNVVWGEWSDTGTPVQAAA